MKPHSFQDILQIQDLAKYPWSRTEQMQAEYEEEKSQPKRPSNMYRSPLTAPLTITSSFQAHLSDSRRNFAGIDLVYAQGESYRRPIVAVSKQRIVKVQNDFVDPNQPLRYGEKYIYAQDLNDPRSTFLYLHNDENQVTEGQIVEEGQQIALMGYSGWTVPDNVPKGTHLHFEVRIDGQRVDPAQYTDFNDFGSSVTPPAVESNNIVTITAQPGDGISHLLKRAGRSDFASEEAWLETSRLNGVNNGLMRVLLGQSYKVATKKDVVTFDSILPPAQKAEVEAVRTIVPEQHTFAPSLDEAKNQLEKAGEVAKETALNSVTGISTTAIIEQNKPVVQASGRIFGVSKKLTAAITAGLQYLAILQTMPPEVLNHDVAGLPISLWTAGFIGILNGLYIIVQGYLDTKK